MTLGFRKQNNVLQWGIKVNTKRAPRNTVREAKENPDELWAEVLLNPRNFAQIQVTEGQLSFVNSDTLPMKLCGAREMLEAAGIEFLGEVEGDALFQYVKLPNGWTKRVTTYPEWSELIDDTGTVRAKIFYKAAVHDRDAFLRVY